MSSDAAEQAVRTGGSNDGGRTTRIAVVALALLAIGLAALAGVGVVGAASADAAAQQTGDVNVTVVFEDDPANDEPEVSSGERFQLTAETTESSDYDVSELDFEWDVVDSAAGSVEIDGNQLTYEPADGDEGETIGFEVEASTGSASDTAGIGVGVETAPTAVVTSLDDPEQDTIEGDSDDTVGLSAFDTTDPDHALAQLDFEWTTSGSGTLQGLSDLNDDYSVDFAAQYEAGPDDAGETFDVTLTVTDPRGLSDTASITLSVADDGRDTISLPGNPSSPSTDDSPSTDSSPAEAEFEIGTIDVPASVEPGEDVDVTLEIENTGDADGTASVEVGIGDAATETVELDVPAGETRETTVTVSAPEEAGDYALGVDTQDDVASSSVTVDDGSVAGGGRGTDDDSTDDSTESGFGLSSLLGAVFILALVGVVARRYVA